MDSLNNEFLTATNINNGRLVQHIDEQIKRIVEDIADPNTVPTAKREINVKISFAPSKSRREAKVEYQVTSKLAAPEKEDSYIYVGKVGGRAVASNQHINQQVLPNLDSTDSEHQQ